MSGASRASAVDLSLESLRRSAAEGLVWLSNQPLTLVAFLLGLSALTNPYAGIVHDASVYSLQALNRINDGLYAGDLFLKYGSQDRYSLFSLLAAPLVRAAGVETAFFLLYLASNALMLWAVVRLLRALIDDPALATAGAILVVVNPLWYGGLFVFQVNEPFFTPRLPACALTLLGLEQMVRGREIRSIALLAVAALAHPLMASGGFMVAGVYWIAPRSRVFRVAASVAAVAVAVGVFFVPALHAFGVSLVPLDDAWRDVVRRAAPYNFPDEWRAADWTAAAASVAVLSMAAAWMRAEAPRTARFLCAVAIAATGGLVLTTVASRMTNALVFQAQPYRALWLATLLQWPFGLWIAFRTPRLHTNVERAAAVLVAVYLARVGVLPVQAIATVVACATFFALRRANPDALRLRAREIVAVGIVCGWTVGTLSTVALTSVRAAELLKPFDPIGYTRVLMQSAGPVSWSAAAIVLAVWLQRRSTGGRTMIAGLAGALVIHLFAFAVPRLPAYEHTFHPERADIDFVRSYLSSLAPTPEAAPTIYADTGGARDVWIDLHARSYFHLTQVIGVMFSRATALEATRRAALAAPFERRRYEQQSEPMGQVTTLMVDRLFPARSASQPSPDSLIRLCADPMLDYAVLRGPRLAGAVAGNARLNVYDCRQLRPAPASTTTPNGNNRFNPVRSLS